MTTLETQNDLMRWTFDSDGDKGINQDYQLWSDRPSNLLHHAEGSDSDAPHYRRKELDTVSANLF